MKYKIDDNIFCSVGAHIGNLKSNYNNQMSFYSMGFRNKIFIFDLNKILLSIINILIILKKSFLYKCNFMGIGIKDLVDNSFIIKKKLSLLNANWFLGNLIGGSLSNRNLSLWQSKRVVNNFENYNYSSIISQDVYIAVNNYSNNALISEILNDYSIISALNDSNVKVDGLTYVLPYNTRSLQSLYIFFTVVSEVMGNEKKNYYKIFLQNKNLYFYYIYIYRLLHFKKSYHKSKFFLHSYRNRYMKKSMSYHNMVSELCYDKFNSFFKRAKRRSQRFRNAKVFLFNKVYIRNRVRFALLNVVFNKWKMFFLKNLYTTRYLGNTKNLADFNYVLFSTELVNQRMYRYSTFFRNNKRFYSKILNAAKYNFFFERNISKKRMYRDATFFKSPRYQHHYIFLQQHQNTSIKKIKKCFNFVKSSMGNSINGFLSIFRYLKNKRKYFNYVWPKEWTFYMKDTPYTKFVFPLEKRWFKWPNKYLARKYDFSLLRRRKRHKRPFKRPKKMYNYRYRKKRF